jgi:hypothetical protein
MSSSACVLLTPVIDHTHIHLATSTCDVLILESLISQLLPTNLYLLCSREYKVHPCWLVASVCPPMDRASLDTDIPGFHLDDNSIVQTTMAQLTLAKQ